MNSPKTPSTLNVKPLLKNVYDDKNEKKKRLIKKALMSSTDSSA